MVDLIQERKQEVAEICGRYRVLRLALFGSAARADFEPETSDLDFLVEFFPMQPQEHSHAYFGLVSELERLFRRSVDLVEASAVRNPYIRRNIEASQVPLYAA
ncbi:MAG: nucleotidyltransferase domain-containing protein [Candidatus Korobacteraceae bacterium]